MACRQSQTTRRADLHHPPIPVHLNRPAPNAEIAAGEQIASAFSEQAPPRILRIPKEPSSVPRDRSQNTTPCSVPTASIRPSCRIDAEPNWPGTLAAWANVRNSGAASNWYVVSVSPERTTIRPSWLNSGEAAAPVKLSQGRPRIGSQSRSRFSHPLLASSVPAGWKAALMPLLVAPSRVAFRMPLTASQT